MQTPGDIFPTDWSPPPVEFLNPKVQQYHQVGAESPQGPRRMPKKLELEPLDLDTKEGLASLEELFWNMPGTSQQTMTPEVDIHASVSQRPLWPFLGYPFSVAPSHLSPSGMEVREGTLSYFLVF
jgi:hypothetical protein